MINETWRLAARLVLGPERAPAAETDMAIMALGKLGGRELSYGSDLDVIFVLGEDAGLDMLEGVKMAQRFISYLSLPLEEGPGYELDSRLRPSGNSGPLVVTDGSFGRYHKTSMLWERQALLRMRPIHGPLRLRRRMRCLAAEAVFHQDLPPDAAGEIHRLRQRMTRERARLRAGPINPKFSPGGLVDVEFLTQYLQLVHGRARHGGVRSPSTAPAIRALAANRCGPAGLGDLLPAYHFISRTASRLGLIYGRSGDRAAFTPEEIDRRGPYGDEAAGDSARTLAKAMALAATVYRDVMTTENNHAG